MLDMLGNMEALLGGASGALASSEGSLRQRAPPLETVCAMRWSQCARYGRAL